MLEAGRRSYSVTVAYMEGNRRKSTDIRFSEVWIQTQKNYMRTRFAGYETFLVEPSL